MGTVKARITLEDGDMVRIYGPAKLKVVEGILLILGAELTDGFEASIAANRSYTVKAKGRVQFDLELDGETRIERPRPDEEPVDDWLTVAEKILDTCRLPCKIVVLGPVEAGKTSFTALLANRALARGIVPAIIDADVGQADIGPPAFISMTLVSDWVIWLRELEPEALRFVGSIEPGPATGRILSGVRDLAAMALEQGAGVLVVDTDGWVHGWSAVEYKADLIRVLGADYAVVLGSSELARVVERFLPGRVFYARSPKVQAVRDHEDRRNLRSANYRRFLEDAPIREIDLAGIEVYGSCIFSSRRIADDKLYSELSGTLAVEVLYVGSFPGGYCVVVDSQQPVDLQSLRSLQKKLQGDLIIVHTGGFRGVLAGISDGVSDWPAMVEWVDIDSGRIGLRTRYEGPVRRVVFGRIRLGEDFYEAGSRKRIWI